MSERSEQRPRSQVAQEPSIEELYNELAPHKEHRKHRLRVRLVHEDDKESIPILDSLDLCLMSNYSDSRWIIDFIGVGNYGTHEVRIYVRLREESE